LLSACGKRTPPVPPVERVAQKTEISGVQRGSRIVLTWLTPPRNAANSSVLNIDRLDIYRLAEPLDAPLILSEEEFSSRSTLIATIPIADSDFGRKELTFEDLLNFAGQKARLRYSARYANKSGQKAAYSNFFLIEPAARVADPPGGVELVLSQESVTLSWRPPESNIDGSKPANIIGYNIYRKDSGAWKRLNSTPGGDLTYADRFFEFGREYTFLVRTVSLGTNAEPVESLDSKRVAIVPKDEFPPAAPAAITIAAAPNQISIFFAVNTETDVMGYRVYRSGDRDLPLKDWTLLTEPPIQTNTYQDSAVEPGTTYFYYLTAIDRFGNVSSPSEIVGETVP
jgi:hypothetical protein